MYSDGINCLTLRSLINEEFHFTDESFNQDDYECIKKKHFNIN